MDFLRAAAKELDILSSWDDENLHQIIENIASPIDGFINPQTIEEIRNLLVVSRRCNEHSDIMTAKWFVENILTEKEIRELIKSLEN